MKYSYEYPFIWYPDQLDNTIELVDWLQSMPKKDLIGWIQIGGHQGPKISVNFKSRSLLLSIAQGTYYYLTRDYE